MFISNVELSKVANMFDSNKYSLEYVLTYFMVRDWYEDDIEKIIDYLKTYHGLYRNDSFFRDRLNKFEKLIYRK